MNVGVVCGSRSWPSQSRLFDACNKILPYSSIVFHGDARGADRIGALWAVSRGLPVRAFPADWQRLGRSAGVRRSADMLREALRLVADPVDVLVAAFVVGDASRCPGSWFTIREARRLGCCVSIVYPTGLILPAIPANPSLFTFEE